MLMRTPWSAGILPATGSGGFQPSA